MREGKNCCIVSNTKFKDLIRLKQKKNYRSSDIVTVEGLRTINQLAINNVLPLELYLTDSVRSKMDFSKFNGIPIYLLSEYQIKRISSTVNNQKIVGLYKCNYNQIPKDWQNLVYIENISEPGNLGTIVRTSLAFGIDGLVLSPQSCEIWNPKTIRASMGSVFLLPILIREKDWISRTKAVKIVTSVTKGQDFKNFSRPPGRNIYIFGSEAFGVSDEVVKMADISVTLNLKNSMESLSISIFYGIFIYQMMIGKK